MKKLLALLLVSILAFSLMGCAKKADEKKEIILWNAGVQTSDTTGELEKSELPVFQLVKEFEESHPDYKITIVDYSMDDLNKAFTAANMAKEGPDMVAIWAGSSTLAYQDYLVDFNQYLSEDEIKTFDTSSLTHKNNNSTDSLIGLTYGLNATGVMYYNKSILAQYNLTAPTTWDEFVAVSQTLKDNDVTPLVLGDKDGYTSTWVVTSLLGNILGPDNIANLASGGSLKVSGPEFTQALTVWKDYVAAGYTNVDYLTKSDGDAIQDFVQGKAAMLVHGNWSASEYEGMGDAVEVTKIPALSTGEFADYMYSQPNINIAVTNYSKYPEAAVDFAKMLCENDFTVRSNEALYSKEVAARLATTATELTSEGKNVTGFDSIIKSESANEFYKLVPTYLNGSLSLEDFTAKLDSLNQ